MIKSFFFSKKWRLWAWGGFIFIIGSLLAQTWIDVKINEWYKGFYDLLQKATERDVSEFYDGIFLFMKLAIPYVVIYTITNYFTRLYAFRWREAMTFAYMPYWKNVDAKVEGASQRIQEDCMNFAKIVESIGLQIVRAIMLLIAFIPILWGLSSNVIIPWLKDITGSLVYVSLTASLGGLIISWFVGIKLPGLEYNNQKVEAAFRKELVYGEDDRTNYVQPPTILQLFTGIKFNYHRLFLHYGYFDLWLIMYNQTMIIVPYLLMGPGLFTGAMALKPMGVLGQDVVKRKRIAFLGTEVRTHSHSQHFLDRLALGYGWRGSWQEPRVDIASVYIDQFPQDGDLGRSRVKRYGLKLYPTIEQALTLGTGELAVDGVVIIAEHGKYPANEKGQRLYPRYEWFKECVKVFEKSGRSVPVF